MEICVTYANECFKSQIEYSFRLICNLLGLRVTFVQLAEIEARTEHGNKPIISYDLVKPDITGAPHIHIYESEFWRAGYLTEASLPRRPLPRYHDLPVLYSTRVEGQQFVNEKDRRAELLIDIVALVFFLATQYEAVVQRERDYMLVI